jgi:hypothetical protein
VLAARLASPSTGRPFRPGGASDRSSVLCPANAGRYFAAVAGSSDLVLESIADDEFVGISTEIPEMKKKIRPASARANKPEAAIDYPAFQCTNRHEFLIRC